MRRALLVTAPLDTIVLSVVYAAVAAAQPPAVTRTGAIGCESCGDARELARVTGLFLAPGGDVIVVDDAPPMLRRFDSSGRVVWAGGRRGQGPGEYVFPLHVAASADGRLQVLDMSARRITALAPDATVEATVAFPAFAAAGASPAGGGMLVVVSDDFRDSLRLHRWAVGDSSPARFGPAFSNARQPGEPITQPGVAVAPDWSLALIVKGLGGYQIDRITAAGAPLPPIIRDVARVERPPEEAAQLRDRMRMMSARMAEESAARGRAGSAGATSSAREEWLRYRPHFAVDALRYDGMGRLWARTMRAGAGSTTFDVFAADGRYLGEVTIPVAVTSYTIRGATLATATETAEGVPQVVLWSIR